MFIIAKQQSAFYSNLAMHRVSGFWVSPNSPLSFKIKKRGTMPRFLWLVEADALEDVVDATEMPVVVKGIVDILFA